MCHPEERGRRAEDLSSLETPGKHYTWKDASVVGMTNSLMYLCLSTY